MIENQSLQKLDMTTESHPEASAVIAAAGS